jgi:hypothetical protein
MKEFSSNFKYPTSNKSINSNSTLNSKENSHAQRSGDEHTVAAAGVESAASAVV